MSEDETYQRVIENFKEIFTDIPLDTRRDILKANIDMLVTPYLGEETLTNHFSLASNIIRIIIEEKLVDLNYILSILIRYTKNYVGLFLIGLVFRMGANPNIYLRTKGYGNLHILCNLSLRSGDLTDYYFRYIISLLKHFGSNINYPALKNETSYEGHLDEAYVSQIAGARDEAQIMEMTVSDFIRNQGKLPDEDIADFLNSVSDDMLINFSVATDSVEIFSRVAEEDYFKEVFQIEENTNSVLKLFLDISTAGAMNIANHITVKTIPNLNKNSVNTQRIPIYASIISSDTKMFKLMAMKGSAIKYVSVSHIIANYKRYKDKDLKIYKNNFDMLLIAVNIGADIDLYQFELFTSSANYPEIEEIKKAYDVPKWKKLCAVVQEEDEPRQEIKQIAFELNQNYNSSERQMCNKFRQIAMMDRSQFLEAATKRQEDRISTDLSSSIDFTYEGRAPENKCNKRSTVLNNPYAYNDSRMAFYKDEEEEVWCFTSDTFLNLIATKINPYTGKDLPQKFIETVRGQVNLLKNLGLFNFNNPMKDTLKEYFSRSVVNNKKTDYAYNTVVKCLSLYGLSEERFNTLGELSLSETILNEICNVKLVFFDTLSPKFRVIITARIIYSISKNIEDPESFFDNIARATLGDSVVEDQTEDPYEKDEDELNSYLGLLD